MKDHTRALKRAMPETSFAAVVMVAVKSVSAARGADGVNVAVRPAYVTVPATAVSPCWTMNELALKVDGSMALLNAAVMAPATGALPLPSAGLVQETTGGRPRPRLHPPTQMVIAARPTAPVRIPTLFRTAE